jgi:hypothetical protein
MTRKASNWRDFEIGIRWCRSGKFTPVKPLGLRDCEWFNNNDITLKTKPTQNK